MFLHLSPIISITLYVAAAGVYVHALLRQGRALLGRVLLAGAFIAHAIFVVSLLSHESSPGLGFPFSLSLVALLLVALFLLLERRLGLFGAFVAPVGAFFMILSSMLFHLERVENPLPFGGVLLWLHIASALTANVLFVFSFAVSVALILQESLLKRKSSLFLLRKLPPLELLDRWNASSVLIGVLALAIGVGTGFFGAAANQVELAGLDPRLVWSTLILLLYSTFVFFRFAKGVRGRRAAWLSVAGFTTLLSSFLSANLISGSFHVY